MINANMRDAKKLERALRVFTKDAVPIATRDALNRAAFTAQRRARENVKEDFINRNAWSRQSVQVTQATVSNQRSVVGSVAPYMKTQEFGGVIVRRGSEGVPIATSYSAGQGQGTRPRTRLPRKPNKMGNIRLSRRGRAASSRKQANIIAVKQAATSSRKFVFLDLGRRKGIFKVTGGKRNPQVRMVHDLSRPSVIIRPRPWLRPAFDRTVRDVPELYVRALRFQAHKRRLFR